MNLQEMMDIYYEDGLTTELAAARVCQDIVLKAIAIGPLSRNITVKGGVLMRSLTNNNRRATRDIDLDFIHYSIEDESIREFIKKLNCIPGMKIEIVGNIEELKHQDYHGKSINVRITDEEGTCVESKIDIGVHKHLELEQEEYCFDVCMDDEGASLLKNSREQSVVEKLRALLVFGVNDKRYKDIYDMYYLKDYLNIEKFLQYIRLLIFDDVTMRENSMGDVVKRVESSFKDKHYLKLISTSRQRWLDGEIEVITKGIVNFFKSMLAEKYEFRNIYLDETDQAVTIEKICFPPNEACSEEHMRDRIGMAPELFLVAVDQETGRIAGFLNGLATDEAVFRDEFFTDAKLHNPNGANIMLLGLDVLPEYRRQGLATELVRRYVEREKANQRKALILTCLQSKVAMYEKMGFHDDGIANSTWGGEEWHEMSYIIM